MKGTILLVPVGPVPAELLRWLADRLRGVIGQDAAIGAQVPPPANGYDARRQQYRAEAVLAALRALSYPAASRLVGLIDADCYAPRLNFVFGQATLGGREALVALPRLRQSFYGRPEDEQLFRQRTLKEVLHELGHTWGLGHCPDPRCVMHFSNTLEDTDLKGIDFCPRCPQARS